MGIGRLHTSANPRLLVGIPAAMGGGEERRMRGREFPKHIAASRAIVACDRRIVARGLGLEASR